MISMRKKLLLFGILLSFLSFSSVVYAQRSSSLSIRRGTGKSVSKARNIALSNLVTPTLTGLGAMALTDGKRIETVGSALVAYGLVVGPSTGNFYAKDFKRGFIGFAARTTGAILMVDASREIFGNTFADRLKIDDKEVSLTDTKILIGEALVLGSIIYNIITVKKSVEEYNDSIISLGLNSVTVDHKAAPVFTARINF